VEIRALAETAVGFVAHAPAYPENEPIAAAHGF